MNCSNFNIFKKNAGFEYNHEGLEMISKLQAKGFSNLLNDIFENFNLASFSLTDTKSLIEKNVFQIEIKELIFGTTMKFLVTFITCLF